MIDDQEFFSGSMMMIDEKADLFLDETKEFESVFKF